MRILALETTENIASVAVSDDANLLAELQLDSQTRSAASLAPGIQTILKTVGWQPDAVELVAVTVGPGSFTGLRVGVTTAKVFAYAVGAKVLGLDTLQTIADAAPAEIASLFTLVDAQRGEVAAQLFRRNAEDWMEPAGPQQLLSIDAWLAELAPGAAVAGPILEKLLSRLPDGVLALDSQFWRPRAGGVARLASRLFAAGRCDDVWSLVPRYSRRSAAEEKREKKQNWKRE